MGEIQDKATEAAGMDDGSTTRDSKGEWTPRILGKAMPFAWPPQPKKLAKFFLGFPGFLWPFGAALYYGLGYVTWNYLQPGAHDVTTVSYTHLPLPTTPYV